MWEVVSIVVGGQRYTAFERVSVRAAVKEAARSFQIDIAAEQGAQAAHRAFAAGAKVEIAANSDVILTGYVDARKPRLDAGQALITITGRSKSGDLVDCSAVHETGELRDVTPEDVGKALDRFGVGIKADVPMEKVPVFRIVQGETAFEAIERLCRDQALSIKGEADGSATIWDARNAKRQAGTLQEGVNLKVIEATHDWSGRHSEYIVRGQRPIGVDVDDLEVEAVARDAGVDRYRPIIVVIDQDTDAGRAKNRASNRAKRQVGASIRAVGETQGFRDPTGALWEPGNLVWTESPFADLAQDMLIEGVSYVQDNMQGTITTLDLVDPRTYRGKASKGGKSGKAWGVEVEDGDE